MVAISMSFVKPQNVLLCVMECILITSLSFAIKLRSSCPKAFTVSQWHCRRLVSGRIAAATAGLHHAEDINKIWGLQTSVVFAVEAIQAKFAWKEADA